MKTAPETLPDNTETLKNLLLSERVISQQKDAEINQLKQQYHQLLEQWRLSQDKRFGKSSEVSVDQFGLFNEAEQLDDEADAEPAEQETITYQRNKPKRTALPKDLPREVIVHDIDEADKVCDGCGHDLHKMGEDKSEQLEFIPAQIKVIEHVRPKYSCRHCEQKGTEVKVKIAPAPCSAIPKSMATASLLSFIISNKYQYALPLYRQESLFKQYGIELSRQTMASWMLKLTPLLNRMVQRYRQILLQQSVIHADETPLKVINEDKATSYMWVPKFAA